MMRLESGNQVASPTFGTVPGRRLPLSSQIRRPSELTTVIHFPSGDHSNRLGMHPVTSRPMMTGMRYFHFFIAMLHQWSIAAPGDVVGFPSRQPAVAQTTRNP